MARQLFHFTSGLVKVFEAVEVFRHYVRIEREENAHLSQIPDWASREVIWESRWTRLSSWLTLYHSPIQPFSRYGDEVSQSFSPEIFPHMHKIAEMNQGPESTSMLIETGSGHGIWIRDNAIAPVLLCITPKVTYVNALSPDDAVMFRLRFEEYRATKED